MNELHDGNYQATAVEQAPSADARYEADDGQNSATDNHAGQEPGELLTRDEYAAHADHETPDDDELPEHIEEADLASVDAYDEADGQDCEPLTRDEYTESADQEDPADDGTPEHLEEADLAAIDAYDTAHEPAASPAQNEDPSEAPGGTLTDHDPDPVEAEGASGPDAGHREVDTERISALEAERADLRQQLADLRASNDQRMDRFEQQLAELKLPPDRPQSGELTNDGANESGLAESGVTRQRIGELEPPEGQNTKKPPERTWLSNEAVAVGVAAGAGGLTAAADIIGTVVAGDAAGIATVALSFAAAAVALSRKRKEAKDADRSRH